MFQCFQVKYGQEIGYGVGHGNRFQGTVVMTAEWRQATGRGIQHGRAASQAMRKGNTVNREAGQMGQEG